LGRVKDEAGDPQACIADIMARTDSKVSVFAGKAAHTLLNEMPLGFDGDLIRFAAAHMEKWRSDQQCEAFDLYGPYAAFMTIPNVDPSGMIARGFFSEDASLRVMPNEKDTAAMLSDSANASSSMSLLASRSPMRVPDPRGARMDRSGAALNKSSMLAAPAGKRLVMQKLQ
jgi:hypothetical protein